MQPLHKRYVKRFIIFFAVLLACISVWFILSQGKVATPDASSYREFLYPYVFFIMPIIILGDIIYLFTAFINNAFKIALISLIGGMAGPSLLLYFVKTSHDPMASMALIALVVFYAVASIFIFLLLTVIQIIRNRLNR
jgi:hypothetical protein